MPGRAADVLLTALLTVAAAAEPPSQAGPAAVCRAVDGDTIRCGRERIRLLGIDALEMPGHCRSGRRCVAGDPWASRASLAAAMRGRLTVSRVGLDRYGRTLALVTGPRGDLSCGQLRNRKAIYRGDWDTGGALARRCEAAR